MLKVLHQLPPFGSGRTAASEKRASAKARAKLPPLVRAVSSMVGASLRGSTHADDAAKPYDSDALSVTAWHEIFSLMDLAEETDAKRRRQRSTTRFAEVVAADDPRRRGCAKPIRQEGGDASRRRELAFFLHKTAMPKSSSSSPPPRSPPSSTARDADEHARRLPPRADDLFGARQGALRARRWRRAAARRELRGAAENRGAALGADVPGVLRRDGRGRAPAREGRRGGVARAIFGMVDAVVCVGDDDEAADAADVDEKSAAAARAPVAAPPPARATAAPARLAKGAAPSAGGGDRKQALARRAQAPLRRRRTASAAHSVDDFVFPFSLNGDGQIDFHAFLAAWASELATLEAAATAATCAAL